MAVSFLTKRHNTNLHGGIQDVLRDSSAGASQSLNSFRLALVNSAAHILHAVFPTIIPIASQIVPIAAPVEDAKVTLTQCQLARMVAMMTTVPPLPTMIIVPVTLLAASHVSNMEVGKLVLTVLARVARMHASTVLKMVVVQLVMIVAVEHIWQKILL